MKQDTLEGKAKTKNGIKRLCFSIICIFLEVIFINTIVTAIGTIMAPLVAVMLTDFYIVHKGKLDIKEEKDLPVVNARPVICIIIGLAFSFALKLVPAIKLSTFLVLIVTAVLYAIVAKAGAEKKA